MRLAVCSSMSVGFVAAVLLVSQSAWSAEIPECPAYGRNLPVNNQQVMHWKRTTANQFRERANVQGPIVRLLPDKTDHVHFVIQIGKGGEDTLEVIYNEDFGKLPDLRVGQIAQACGDYITASAKSGPYPPSPVGAIIHWIHMNPRNQGHDHGFLAIDGTLYGTDTANAGPRREDRGNRRDRDQRRRNRVFGAEIFFEFPTYENFYDDEFALDAANER